MEKIKTPFFVCNPKSYLYGKENLDLALAADKLAIKYDIEIFYTSTFTDLHMINKRTDNIILTAQHMDSLNPGKGMGKILPESLKNVGVEAVFLNHAENKLKLNKLTKTLTRAKELDIISIVCADGEKEATAIAQLDPNILLYEPPELIESKITGNDKYIIEIKNKIKKINNNILVMYGGGISNGADVYNILEKGIDGTGATSGIMKASNKINKLEDMISGAAKIKNK